MYFSKECRESDQRMLGDLATIDNIRKNEKGSMVGDTLYLTAALTDPKVRYTAYLNFQRCPKSVAYIFRVHHVAAVFLFIRTNAAYW